MNTITADDFQDVLTHLENMDPEEELEPIIDRFSEEQPLLAAFLDEMGGDDFSEEEHEVLLFFGVAVWHAMERHSEEPLGEVTEDILEKIRLQNEPLLERLTSEQGDISAEGIAAILQGHPQKALLEEVFDIVRDEESDSISPKHLGDILVFLKITVDCLLEG